MWNDDSSDDLALSLATLTEMGSRGRVLEVSLNCAESGCISWWSLSSLGPNGDLSMKQYERFFSINTTKDNVEMKAEKNLPSIQSVLTLLPRLRTDVSHPTTARPSSVKWYKAEFPLLNKDGPNAKSSPTCSTYRAETISCAILIASSLLMTVV